MSKVIGATLLVVGTSIGAGILALPVSTSEAGFISSSIFLFFCWIFMTFSALLILEATFWTTGNTHLISIAKKTLGLPGQIATWLSFLILLYTLLSAYISGGSDVLQGLLSKAGIHLPSWLGILLFTGALGAVVYGGLRNIDYVNRGLMIVKLGSFILLLFFVVMNVNPTLIEHTNLSKVLPSLMIMIAAFGFATIVPSLKIYFEGNVKKLRAVIIIGSFIPLIFYILWDLAILGTLPLEGEHGLVAILNSGHITSELMNALQEVVRKSTVTTLSKIFSSICVATSFLGVALSLSDFLSDGLGIEKKGWGNVKVQLLTFLPPLIVVLLYPAAFLIALDYAGIFTVILLTLLPTLMVWRGRYHLKFSGPYQVAGGKIAMSLSLLASVGAIIIGALQQFKIIF